MTKRYRILSLVLLFVASPLFAYEILLDIDTDFDPTTINDLTYDTSAVVKLILKPDFSGEMIGRVEFGLGGSCRDCNSIQQYGTNHDLIDWVNQPWIQCNGMESGWDAALHMGCYDSVSSHLLLWFQPLGGGEISLNQSIFLAEFTVWVADPVPAHCTQPPSNLATMNGATYWNYVQLGGPALGNTDCAWSMLKTLYR